jgi:hypothetical protein
MGVPVQKAFGSSRSRSRFCANAGSRMESSGMVCGGRRRLDWGCWGYVFGRAGVGRRIE